MEKYLVHAGSKWQDVRNNILSCVTHIQSAHDPVYMLSGRLSLYTVSCVCVSAASSAAAIVIITTNVCGSGGEDDLR